MGDFEPHSKQATKSRATAGPSADDRFGPGVEAKHLAAYVLKVDIVNGGTLVTLSKGSVHGVRQSLPGYIKGLYARFLVQDVKRDTCRVFVDATLDQLKGFRHAVINPRTMPRAPTTPDPATTRVIAVRVEGGRTRIIIPRGSAHGIERGTRGHLVAPNGDRGDPFELDYVTSTQGHATIANTVDYVRAHMDVKLELSASTAAAPVQRRASGTTSTDDVNATAQAGVAGASSQLPFFDTIQRAFGKHDISNIQSQVGGPATAASEALGARAYATGDKVAFASAPDLHTAAHEAAHTIQQRHGAVGFQGLGAADDEHERHADAVADAVVAGESAEPLLDQVVGGSATTAIQRKPNPASEIMQNGLPTGRGSMPAKQGPGPTGNPYIDHGAACEGAQHPDCFMTSSQRETVIKAIELRVLHANMNFLNALATVELAKVLAKDPESVSWTVNLMIDVAATYLTARLSKGLISLRNAKGKQLADRVQRAIELQVPDDPQTWLSRLERAVAGIKEETIKNGVKTGLDAAKKPVKARAKSPSTRSEEAIDFLNQMKSTSNTAFARMREGFAATSSDAELLALYELFDIENQHVHMFEQAIREKLHRFEQSKVGRIGRREEKAGALPVKRDLFVVWEIYESGAPPRLAFRHRDWPVQLQGRAERDADRMPMKLVTSKTYRGTTHGAGANNVQLVPHEFVQAAVALHERSWGVPPAVERIDDRAARHAIDYSTKTPPSDASSNTLQHQITIPDVFDVDPDTGKRREP